MKTAILNNNFKTLFFLNKDDYKRNLSDVDEDCIARFKKGDKVEILRVIEDLTYQDGAAYVILNTRNNESITIHGGLLEFE